MRNQSLAHLLMGPLFLSLMACAGGISNGDNGIDDGYTGGGGDVSTGGGDDGSTGGGDDGSTGGGDDGSTGGGDDGSTGGGDDGSTGGGDDGSTGGGDDGSTGGGDDGSTGGGDDVSTGGGDDSSTGGGDDGSTGGGDDGSTGGGDDGSTGGGDDGSTGGGDDGSTGGGDDGSTGGGDDGSTGGGDDGSTGGGDDGSTGGGDDGSTGGGDDGSTGGGDDGSTGGGDDGSTGGGDDGSTGGGDDGSTGGGDDGSTGGGDDGSTGGGDDGSTGGGDDGSTGGGDDGSTGGGDDGSTGGGDDGSTGGSGGSNIREYYGLTDMSEDALNTDYTLITGLETTVKVATNNHLYPASDASNDYEIKATSRHWSYFYGEPSDLGSGATYTPNHNSEYEYVQSYTLSETDSETGSLEYKVGITGRATNFSEILNTGSATYNGTAEGEVSLYASGGTSILGHLPASSDATSEVTANFAGNSVDVEINTNPSENGALVVNVTGMKISGNGFSLRPGTTGTVTVSTADASNDYTSNYTHAQGYFYGPVSNGSPAEVGGIVAGNGIGGSANLTWGFHYIFMAKK